jgi:hypothetical protein
MTRAVIASSMVFASCFAEDALGKPVDLAQAGTCGVRLHRLALARSESRFYALLHRQLFDEVLHCTVASWPAQAIAFATQFSLDVGLVHRVRTTGLLDRAVHHAKPSILEVPYPSHLTTKPLKACLGPIDDIEFVVDSCLQAALPSTADVAALMQWGISRLQVL